MAQQHLNTGSQANDNTGDPLRTAFIKTEDNFTNLYNIRGPSYLPNYTGSLIMTSSEGGDPIVLKLTGSLETTLTSSMSTASVKFNNGDSTQYGYIRKLTEGSEDASQSYPHIKLRGGTSTLTEEIYLVPNDTTGFVLFSKLFTSKAIRIGTTSAKAMDLFIKSQNNDNVFRVTNRIVGINILPSGLGTNSIGINGIIRAQNYFVFNVPQNSGDFQSTDSDTISGNGGTTQVVYIP